MLKKFHARWVAGFFIGATLMGIAVLAIVVQYPKLTEAKSALNRGLNKAMLARALGDSGIVDVLPSEVNLTIDGQETRSVVQYAFDPQLQEEMEGLFHIYRPDYGAFVAIDAETGRVLSLVSYTYRRREFPMNLALRATFPSASVFKMVTAAAAIADKKFNANTVIPFNGRDHTLYRSNILKTNLNRWTRYITLKDAFARSVNSVFGKIGAFSLGAETLRTYADRFLFNQPIPADVPVQEGSAKIEPGAWALASAASGFTRDNTMSPLQGALMAATIVNEGVMMEPYVVDSVYTLDGTAIYGAEPKISGVVIDPKTAAEMRKLMKETVVRGTSRGSFRGFFKGNRAELRVGGKTGSLSGTDPVGKYDWFVGFAEGKNRRIAVAALTIHEEYWRVKSSYLARKAFENIFHQKILGQAVAQSLLPRPGSVR